MLRELRPGPWFSSVGAAEYRRLYFAAVLDQLDPKTIIAKIHALAGDGVPVLCCFEKPDGKSWCHRAMVAEWLHDRLGMKVLEFGFEHLPQAEHPLLPKARCR